MSDHDGRLVTEIIVSLERPVTIPGGNHHPPQTKVFRCSDESVKDGSRKFFGLSIGPSNAVLEVSEDNIRAICYLGEGNDVDE